MDWHYRRLGRRTIGKSVWYILVAETTPSEALRHRIANASPGRPSKFFRPLQSSPHTSLGLRRGEKDQGLWRCQLSNRQSRGAGSSRECVVDQSLNGLAALYRASRGAGPRGALPSSHIPCLTPMPACSSTPPPRRRLLRPSLPTQHGAGQLFWRPQQPRFTISTSTALC